MKLTYDPAHNIAYLRLHEKKAHVDTIRVSDTARRSLELEERAIPRIVYREAFV